MKPGHCFGGRGGSSEVCAERRIDEDSDLGVLRSCGKRYRSYGRLINGAIQ